MNKNCYLLLNQFWFEFLSYLVNWLSKWCSLVLKLILSLSFLSLSWIYLYLCFPFCFENIYNLIILICEMKKRRQNFHLVFIMIHESSRLLQFYLVPKAKTFIHQVNLARMKVEVKINYQCSFRSQMMVKVMVDFIKQMFHLLLERNMKLR